ncbi:SH3 domain-containing protein [bacterium]|nr:SH3 domain-containing protein [bacterium]
MKEFAIILIFLSICCFTSDVESYDLTKRIGIGLGNPYASLKYGINSKFSTELRCAYGEDILVIGPRFYYNFNPKEKIVIYVGGEGDCVTFDKDDMKGNGYIGMAFIGMEYFSTNNLTFCTDIGQAYVSLSKDNKNEADGIGWVINLGINYYFSAAQTPVLTNSIPSTTITSPPVSTRSPVAQQPPKQRRTVTVIIDNVPIFSGPGTTYPIITTVPAGVEIILVDDSRKWYYQIELPDGILGWISYVNCHR